MSELVAPSPEFAADAAPPSEQAEPERLKFKVDEAIDESRLPYQSYGSILLYYREAIFNQIHRAERLDEMIGYFLKHAVLFAGVYGAILGCYSFSWQIPASAIKIPLVILGTMGICLPALFTFNVLLGSKLSFKQTLAVLSMSTYMMATVLISLAPILLFFIISSRSEDFSLLLNVMAFSIAGVFSVSLLWAGMGYLTLRAGHDFNVRIVRVWTLIYIFVGTQLAWILRPYIGEADQFVVFRALEGNFYKALVHIVLNIF